ncbi:hypothetical protein [Acidocella aminolytica]|uniref:Uncharacterized protein n=1 Tax=Acidocella aminolytica 101 = DSM 11237 TaxID=1120923 RepID=A0A0D6PBP7_9PROT|nr:hypothetical protein [Acidocella aminolytica]GAN78618.1 hypothetical protein Aam_005_017 [Acidocella aminolytica 101 = DSM 11237]GBQ35530.1 hypothetical protein AA11237_0997 [Acidocella aminolytica 101 = DSM 11237]SHE43439.1 hypothetical protein SAMN02746095_00427 [Acidocella aminolytica 101 = DSM 11237]
MILESKQVAENVAGLLNSYAEGKNASTEVVKSQVMALIFSNVPSLDQAVASYRINCDDFLAKTIAVKGMPTRTIIGGSTGEIVSSSGRSVADNFQKLLPLIKKCHASCIENYRTQAKICFEKYVSDINQLIDQFLAEVPRTAKERAPYIARIKREIRYFSKWNQLFYTHKAMSFPSEVEYIFIMSGEPLAAVWEYSSLDEECEFPPDMDHKQRDGRVYAVRRNWAEAKSLMVVGSDGYIDEIDRPHQETGCMCHLHWLYSISDLPEEMLTAKGKASLEKSTTTQVGASTPPRATKKPSAPVARKSWLSRLFSKS